MFYPELRNQFFENPELKNRFKTIGARDYEKDLPNKHFQVYEYNLSHNRAIARISDGSNKEYFNGSSLNRKKTIKKEKENIQKPAETLNQSFFKESRYRANVLFNVEKIAAKRKNPIELHGLSRRTKIKIKEKMLALYAAAKNNFTLLTLTLVNDCEDTKAVKMLNKFLTATKKQIGTYNYVWVAERQENGRIHFHMIVDKKLDINYVNSLWVVQQFNSGVYHDFSNEKLKLYTGLNFKQLHKMGELGQQIAHEYLNPVDVVKVKTIDGVSAYLTIYILKNETKMSCAVWHCNRNVSRLFTKQLISQQQFDFTSDPKINKIQSRKTKKEYAVKTFVHQYGMINTIYNKKYFNKILHELNLINSWILEDNEYKINCGVKMEFDVYKRILYAYDTQTGEIKTASLKDYKTTAELLYYYKQSKN